MKIQSWRHYAGRLVDKLVLPLVPGSGRIRVQYIKSVYLLGYEAEIKHIRSFARRSSVAVDVGANIGLYSYAMANSGMFDRVVAIEPNPMLTANLIDSGGDNLTVIHKAVSDGNGTGTLKIPIQQNVSLTGWASLEAHIDVDTNIFEEISVEKIRLDDLDLVDCGFIKVDVEGHELPLLSGAREFFKRNRPVCLIECRQRNEADVKEYFQQLQLGYALIDTASIYGFQLSEGNLLFSAQ